ncbi:MAG: TonB-dependent receptor [Alphaproteobacteria bacterium]|jgi:vitamin B12 transporter|nr:TonB-dependent receptor [Alphaproteobacteria bacterium]
MSKQSLILTAATLVLADMSMAQTGENAERLDTVTVTGLRPVPLSDVTAAVTILDSEDLELRAAPYLADELRAVPGLTVSRSGALGGLTQVRLRGAEANHTLLLIDGIEVSDPVTGESDFGLFSGLRPQRVEVLRGEQSGLYGSDAIGGVINIVTGGETGLIGRAELGSRDTLRGDLGYGFDAGRSALTVSAGGFSTQGVDTSGSGGEEDGSESYNFLATGTHGPDGGWQVSGLARYGRSDVETDPDLDFDGRLDDGDRVTEAEHWTLGGAFGGPAGGFDHQFRASFNAVARDNFADGDFTDAAEGERTKVSYSPSRRFEAGKASLRLAGLIDYEIEDYSARDTQFGGATNQDECFETLGLAGEARVDFGRLRLAANLRHDDNDGRFEAATTGRLSGAVQVHRDHRLRASIGTGVKNPTFTELFGFFPGSFVGNPELEPEQSTSWEIGWDGKAGPLDLSATWFEAELEDEIFTAFNPDFTSTALNREGESERSGLEIGARWQAGAGLSLAGQATFIDSTADDGADEIRVPSETASLSVDYRPDAWNGARAGLALDYVGEQDDFDFGAVPAARVTLDSYALASASAEWPLSEKVALTLRGENLLDEEVTDVFGFRGPGAGLFVGLRLR